MPVVPGLAADLEAPARFPGGSGRNVLLVLLEGVSGFYLPTAAEAHGRSSVMRMNRLDRTFRENVGFTTFLTHQRRTNRGLYSILCGEPPRLLSGMPKMTVAANGGWRRSVYLQYRRTEIPTMMDTFDYPEMGPNCVQRNISTVSPQSLMLMNNDHIRELAGDFAARVLAQVSENASAGDRVDAVYRIALSRGASAEERLLGEKALAALSEAWRNDSQAVLHSFCHTILNSAAFSYVD